MVYRLGIDQNCKDLTATRHLGFKKHLFTDITINKYATFCIGINEFGLFADILFSDNVMKIRHFLF